MHTRDSNLNTIVSKVPQVTLAFWVVKILATTLGETGGDAVTMSWLGETTPEAKGTGYPIGTGIFGVIFIGAVLVQIRAKKFHPVPLLGNEPLGSTIDGRGNFLLCAHGGLCKRWRNCILPAFSKRRPAVVGSSDFGWRCGDHGDCRNSVFPRTAIMAENRGSCVRDHWLFSAT